MRRGNAACLWRLLPARIVAMGQRFLTPAEIAQLQQLYPEPCDNPSYLPEQEVGGQVTGERACVNDGWDPETHQAHRA